MCLIHAKMYLLTNYSVLLFSFDFHAHTQSCVLLQVPSTTVNGGIHTERKVGNRDRERNRVGSGESEHESLLVHENTPKYVRHKQLQLCTEQGKRQNRAKQTALQSSSGNL